MMLRRLALSLIGVGLVIAGAACDRSPAQHAVLTRPTAPPIGVPKWLDLGRGLPQNDASIILDFGAVRVGSAATRSVQVHNAGTAAFTVVGIESATNAAAFAYSNRPFTVSPGGTGSLEVTFRATRAGQDGDTLTLAIENGDPRQLSIVLIGAGEAPRQSPAIQVEPATLAFGEAAVDTFVVRRVGIVNVGEDVPGTDEDNLRFATNQNGTWVETRAEIAGPDAADFSVEWPPFAYVQAGLADSQSTSLRVRFSPHTEGRKSATLTVYSNDPERPQVEVPLYGLARNLPACDFAVSPPLVNFGFVETNKYLTMNFAIKNLDADPSHECLIALLDLTPATVSSGVFALVNGPVESAAIRGGESLFIPVRFQPKTEGQFSGEVAFYISSPSTPEAKVELSAIAGGDCLMIEPRELDFGSIGVHCKSRQKAVTMYNTCTSALTVSAINVSAGQDEFTLTKLPQAPFTISGGSSAEFGVTYRPIDHGEDTGTLAVTVSGRAQPYTVTATGRGGVGSIQTDAFSQSDMPLVDVLFVVDNSATMADKQASLAANLATFVDFAIQRPVDFHIAVTTTDVTSTGEAGRLVPLSGSNPTYVTRTTPNAAQVLKQNLSVGTSGSETESLLRPAYLALTNPQVSGHNAGFYRDFAKLVVIIISDAADQDPAETPVSFYENFLLNLKGFKRNSDLNVSAIVPRLQQAPAGCTYDAAGAGIDVRVSSLVSRTGGLINDICAANWASTLMQLGSRIFAIRTVFFLSNSPDMTVPDGISITVDGQPYPQYDSQGVKRWDYNPASNAIEFEPLSAPSPSSEIRVSYYVACG